MRPTASETGPEEAEKPDAGAETETGAETGADIDAETESDAETNQLADAMTTLYGLDNTTLLRLIRLVSLILAEREEVTTAAPSE